MSKSNVVEFVGRKELGDPLTDLLRRVDLLPTSGS